ncbi:MAG: hypothetical protein LUQ22_07545 [Methanotrichaceae archaeon]|nr:hypothetical protein [Methanotrichaceae archaeon]
MSLCFRLASTAELAADKRIEKIAIECLELLENRLKDRSSQVDIKTTAETLKARSDVLEHYKETVENRKKVPISRRLGDE